MNMKLIALSLAPIFALGACAGGGDAGNTTAGNTTVTDTAMPAENGMMGGNAMQTGMPASPGQAFADTAGASDWYEIEAGKLAQEKATTPALKDFGQMMVKGHTASTEKLKAAGAKANPAITPNPALTAEQEANLAALRAAEGTAFDAAYKMQQVAAHEKTLAAVKDYAEGGDVPELKAFAAEMSKVVKMHLDKIKGM
ncbi:DUF4142 domain-containing protein [Sphingomonas sp.]|jgi:putative membrane protein|uniref:DUF4142 domain-containing protein n=1 Tax=Sphingomonas sp. TaxID=28214 RepID=UPI002ED8E693